jgi:hypothetical protein
MTARGPVCEYYVLAFQQRVCFTRVWGTSEWTYAGCETLFYLSPHTATPVIIPRAYRALEILRVNEPPIPVMRLAEQPATSGNLFHAVPRDVLRPEVWMGFS